MARGDLVERITRFVHTMNLDGSIQDSFKETALEATYQGKIPSFTLSCGI